MHNPLLIRELMTRYQVGEAYASAYMDFWTQPGGRHAGERPDSLADILKQPLPDPMWFDYAMSANVRGRELAALVTARPERPNTIRRVLDIGCGFGGVLVAFAQQGADVCGIEPAPERVTLSRANCQDAGHPDAVRQGDVLDEQLVSTLGEFDLATMVDVIEHVLDVPKAIAHATRLLRPGGMLWLEIPNRHSVNFVTRDGHFSLFGITLLDRDDAAAYHRVMFTYPYDVGEYHALPYYRELIERQGCRFSLGPALGTRTLRELPALRRGMDEAARRFDADTASRLPDEITRRVHERVNAYRTDLDSDAQAVRADPVREAAFVETYLVDFWRVIASRPAAR